MSVIALSLQCENINVEKNDSQDCVAEEIIDEDLEVKASPINLKKEQTKSLVVQEVLSNQSFYELLNSQEGFLTLQAYFIKAALLLDRDMGAVQGGYSSHMPEKDQVSANLMLDGNGAGPSAFRMSANAYAGYTSGAPTNQSSILAAAQQAAWGSGVRGGTGAMYHINGRMSAGGHHGMNYTGGGTLQSSIVIEVDEFKFYNIVRNVLYKQDISTQEDDEHSPMRSTQLDQSSFASLESSAQDTSIDCNSAVAPGDTRLSITSRKENSTRKGTKNENSLTWIQSMELYETLDSSGMDSVGFREFCTLIFIISAVQSSQLVQCLYEHGVLIFDVISGGQQLISGERLKVLARILGFTETCKDSEIESLFDFGGNSQVSLAAFEDFQLYYHEVFSKQEQGNFKNDLIDLNVSLTQKDCQDSQIEAAKQRSQQKVKVTQNASIDEVAGQSNCLENSEPDLEHTQRDKERLLEDDTGIMAANAVQDLKLNKQQSETIKQSKKAVKQSAQSKTTTLPQTNPLSFCKSKKESKIVDESDEAEDEINNSQQDLDQEEEIDPEMQPVSPKKKASPKKDDKLNQDQTTSKKKNCCEKCVIF